MSTSISEHDVTVLLGDVREQLATLGDGSVNCVVTSPPYFGLRAYSDDPREIGREQSPAEYVANLLAIFADVARVLRADGTFWLNMGDSYYSGRGNPGPNADDKKNQSRRGWTRALDVPGQPWGRRKSLLMIPERVVLGLLDDGWILRNKGIWHKTNAMPESVTDRLACQYEHLYLLTRSPNYYFDLDAIRVPRSEATEARYQYAYKPGNTASLTNHLRNGGMVEKTNPAGKNPGDVWSIPTRGVPGDHPAVMTSDIARLCISAGSKEGGAVLDPFAGSGTTLMVARSLGRRSIGIELNADYIDIIKQRIGQTPINFAEVTA